MPHSLGDLIIHACQCLCSKFSYLNEKDGEVLGFVCVFINKERLLPKTSNSDSCKISFCEFFASLALVRLSDPSQFSLCRHAGKKQAALLKGGNRGGKKSSLFSVLLKCSYKCSLKRPLGTFFSGYLICKQPESFQFAVRSSAVEISRV